MSSDEDLTLEGIIEAEKSETDKALAGLIWVTLLILLACSPAVVIAVWKWAL